MPMISSVDVNRMDNDYNVLRNSTVHRRTQLALEMNFLTPVANAESRFHDTGNLWVGENGCIPDAIASNPAYVLVIPPPQKKKKQLLFSVRRH
jgi:hypothetical protein